MADNTFSATSRRRSFSDSLVLFAFDNDDRMDDVKTKGNSSCLRLLESVSDGTTARHRYLEPGKSNEYLGTKKALSGVEYHIWKNGSCMPTEVDGQTVNPVWGLTTSGNPRKRIGKACLNCRERKSKCEPCGDSCVACERAGRQCQLANSEHPSTIKMQKTERDGSECPSSMISLCSTREASSDIDIAAPRHSLYAENPFLVYPDATLHLLGTYFIHASAGLYDMVPCTETIIWAQQPLPKALNELAVLYALLAVGSLFAEHRFMAFGKYCSDSARRLLMSRGQGAAFYVMQALVLLSFYQLGRKSNELSRYYIQNAVEACVSPQLRLDTEEGCIIDRELHSIGTLSSLLSPRRLSECKRSTFWACVIMERHLRGPETSPAFMDATTQLPIMDDEDTSSSPSSLTTSTMPSFPHR